MFINSVSIFHSAIQLLERGTGKIEKDEIASGYVDLSNAERTAEAGSHAIRVEDEMYRSFLDIFA
ncbi:MAG: hypothetical protein V3V99_13325 [candidate division Zixibacteria bacterium]